MRSRDGNRIQPPVLGEHTQVVLGTGIEPDTEEGGAGKGPTTLGEKSGREDRGPPIELPHRRDTTPERFPDVGADLRDPLAVEVHRELVLRTQDVRLSELGHEGVVDVILDAAGQPEEVLFVERRTGAVETEVEWCAHTDPGD